MTSRNNKWRGQPTIYLQLGQVFVGDKIIRDDEVFTVVEATQTRLVAATASEEFITITDYQIRVIPV